MLRLFHRLNSRWSDSAPPWEVFTLFTLFFRKKKERNHSLYSPPFFQIAVLFAHSPVFHTTDIYTCLKVIISSKSNKLIRETAEILLLAML